MNILIVDDEMLICEWLEYCIAQTPDCELVGCAHNGEEGLELFLRHKPDLVLTDIKMPLMNGLELLQAIRKESAETMVVMLTAYSEFDFVRQAMRIGATEFILKTEVDKSSMQELLLRLVQTSVSGGAPKADDKWQRQSVIKDILLRTPLLSDEDVRNFKKQGIQWKEGGFFAIAVWKNLLTQGFSFPEETSIHQVIGFEYSEELYVFVGSLPRVSGTQKLSENLTVYLTHMMTQGIQMLGVSHIGSNIRKLPELIKEAVAALSTGFYQNRSRIYHWQMPSEDLDKNSDAWDKELKNCYKLYCKAKPVDKMDIVSQTLDYCRQNRVYPIRLVTRFCISVMEDAYNLSTASIPGREDIQTAEQRFYSALYCEERFRIFMDFMAEYMAREPGEGKVLSPGVAKAAEIIKKDYASPLSLEQVAALVELNPEYLSRIFKEETGFTFTAFLTNLRMKKAANLLIHTTTKVNLIGQKAGYPNVSYFSTLFKKNFGISPFEYRRQYHI